MKKAVLCSLSVVSIFSLAAAAESSHSSSSIATYDMSAGWYAGAGVNQTATDSFEVTGGSVSLDEKDLGFGLLVGKKFTDLFSVEAQYLHYGDIDASGTIGPFPTTVAQSTVDYSQQYSVGVNAVLKSPSVNGFSVLGKAGASYFHQKAVGTTPEDGLIEGYTTEVTYSGTNLSFGVGAQYDYKDFAVRFDWFRIDNDGVVNIPDLYELSVIYNFQ